MKKILLSLVMLFSFVTYSQQIWIPFNVEGGYKFIGTYRHSTIDKFNDGSITIDTTDLNLTKWSLYKIHKGELILPEIGINKCKFDSLVIGEYWLIGETLINNQRKIIIDQSINIVFRSYTQCDDVGGNSVFNYTFNVDSVKFLLNRGSNYNEKITYEFYFDSIQLNNNDYQIIQNTNTDLYNGKIDSVSLSIPINNFFQSEYSSVSIVMKSSNGCVEVENWHKQTNCRCYPQVEYPKTIEKETSDTTLSIIENNEVKFEVFPNPFKDVLKIKCIENTDIKIYNLMGGLVYQTSGDNLEISTDSFESGNYILEVLTSKNIKRQIVTKN